MIQNFPWRKENWDLFLRSFDREDFISVEWPWEPFHRRGFRALSYLAEKNFSEKDAAEILNGLSCPAPPKNLEKKFLKLGLLDHDGRIGALDPAFYISETLKLAGGSLESFKNQNLVLPTIRELLDSKPQLLSGWSPVFHGEITYLSNWLSKKKALLETFQAATPWTQLELFENLVGVSKPWTLLNFQRIVS